MGAIKFVTSPPLPLHNFVARGISLLISTMMILGGGERNIIRAALFVSEETWVVFSKFKNVKRKFSFVFLWIVIGFRDDVRKLSSNLFGGFSISRAHLKILSQILLVTKKNSAEWDHLFIFVFFWKLDAIWNLEFPVKVAYLKLNDLESKVVRKLVRI